MPDRDSLPPILYATDNKVKFLLAELTCQRFDIKLTQSPLQVDEIQAEDGVAIARDKANKAFAKFNRPVVISDSNWSIPALNGFPGPYMKSVNTWFTTEDWLNLTKPLTDRRITLREIVAYQDQSQQKVFFYDTSGILLDQVRGDSQYPHVCITSFDNGQHSMAELHQRNQSAVAGQQNVWHLFAEWYTAKHATA